MTVWGELINQVFEDETTKLTPVKRDSVFDRYLDSYYNSVSRK